MKSALYIIVSCIVFLLGATTCFAQAREFRDTEGKVFSATIGRVPEGGWCFILPNGQMRRINPDELAPADREYMLDWIAKAEHAMKNPGATVQASVPATATSARVQYNFAVYWTEAVVKDAPFSLSQNREESRKAVATQMARERAAPRTQNIKSVPLGKLNLDPLKFQIWSFSEKKTCQVKLVSKSVADLAGLAVKYRIHYFADGSRSDAVHTSSETRIHVLKGSEPHEFETVPVELKCIETQPFDKNRIPKGPVSRSAGEIKGLSLVIIHNGKVVHQYVSAGVKPADAIKE